MKFEATKDFQKSFKNIKVLIRLSYQASKKNNDENRNLFLKLSLVLLVTRFQVFIESILKEFDYSIKQSTKKISKMPVHYRLNSIKLSLAKKQFHRELENTTTYSSSKLADITSYVNTLSEICDNNFVIQSDIMFETKFPMGKNGLNEIIDLFKQIDGKNIFENSAFDVNKINEILSRCHDIIHEDKNQQITETTIEQYRDFLHVVSKHIDSYLKQFTLKGYKPPAS